jgi:hypothetical protein
MIHSYGKTIREIADEIEHSIHDSLMTCFLNDYEPWNENTHIRIFAKGKDEISKAIKALHSAKRSFKFNAEKYLKKERAERICNSIQANFLPYRGIGDVRKSTEEELMSSISLEIHIYSSNKPREKPQIDKERDFIVKIKDKHPWSYVTYLLHNGNGSAYILAGGSKVTKSLVVYDILTKLYDYSLDDLRNPLLTPIYIGENIVEGRLSPYALIDVHTNEISCLRTEEVRI